MASDLGSALERATSNIFQLLLQKRQLDLQQSQFQQQLDLSERRFASEERGNAFERVAKFIPFLKPGTSVADNPVLHDDLRKVFEGQDPASPEGLGGLVLNPESLENVIVPAMIDQFETLDPADRKKLLDRGVARNVTGEATSSQERGLKDSLIGIQVNALNQIMQDPEAVANLGRRALGIPDQDIEIPGLGMVTLTSEDASRLAVEMWKHREVMNFQRQDRALDATAKNDIAGEFMKLAQEKKLLLSRARAMQIINAVHYVPPDAESISQEEILAARQEQVDALPQTEGWNPVLDAALDLYIRGADLADQAPIPLLDGFPGLQQYLRLGSQLEGILGKEPTAKILPMIAEELSDRGVGIFDPGQGVFNRRSMGDQAGQEPRTGPQGFSGGGRSRQPRVPPRDAALQDAQAYKDGKLTLKQLTDKWGAERARAIIQQSRGLQ